MSEAAWTPEQLEELEERFRKASTPAAQAAHMKREWRRVWRTMPRRVRVRSWITGRQNRLGCWLVEREWYRLAAVVWPSIRGFV